MACVSSTNAQSCDTIPEMPLEDVRSVVIEFRTVGYSFGAQPLLRNISFSVAAGETLVLLGRSGSGKTTALKLINRLLTPTYGEVVVQGRATSTWDPIALRRSIGWVIQESGLFPHYSLEKNIALVPHLAGWPEERVQTRVTELMHLVGLEATLRKRFPHQLSGGQRQRVGVARALAADPKILLMDEPFGALDPITRAELQKEFLALQQRLRKTVVIVTHDVREALLLGNRIALLENGGLVSISTKDQFANSTQSEITQYTDSLREGMLPI
jgi:osmoprotectant transport system ATP-binding protein